ncbi:MAG TPA: septum formation initiator family protein [Tissierellaceae bacterium]|nr:septum formation initiator family protein [Tissierellaceae bacterium]
METRKKRRRKKRFGLFHFIILLGLVYIIVVFWKQEKLLSELEAKKQENVLEVESLEKDIKVLEKEIEESDTLKFVEKVAREELGFVKPRELIYIDKNKKNNSIFYKNRLDE